MSSSSTRENIKTPANMVTLARICGIPVFVVAIIAPWPAWLFPGATWVNDLKPWIAAALFVILACTDAVDGYLARSRNEVTNFGKLVDPLADKLLVAAALIALVELQVLPSWVVLIILSREFIVSGVRMIAASQGTVIAASWYGKAKTVSQIIAIVLFILKDSLLPATAAELKSAFYWFCWFAMIVAVVLTIVSMLDYLSKARHLFGFQPKMSKKAQVAYDAAMQVGDLNVLPIDQTALTDAACKVLDAARGKKLRISCAESLTGGLVGGILTSIPGSSDVLAGSIVSYAYEAKSGLLGVSADRLAAEGAVTEYASRAMAEGALRAFGTDIAVSTTGIAGPGGAEEGKPVGTVWICVASSEFSTARRFQFTGNRQEVRAHTAAAALHMLGEGISAR